MSLLYAAGFDAGLTAIYGTNGHPLTVSGRNGGGLNLSAYNDSGRWWTIPVAPNGGNDIYIGFAMNWNGSDMTDDGGGGTNAGIRIRNGINDEVSVFAQRTTRELRANRGTAAPNNALLAISPQPIPINQWVYIELYIRIANSGGRVVAKINGETVIDFTGDTSQSSESITLVQFRNWNGASIDDVYIADTAGAVNNSFLGDVAVLTARPSGAGASAQLTPSAGANWECVDENPMSDTDFVSSDVAGHQDLYVMSDIPTNYEVKGVQTTVRAKKDDAGYRQVRHLVRSAGTTYDGDDRWLGTNYAASVSVFNTDPATGVAWTPAGVNAAEAGVEVV